MSSMKKVIFVICFCFTFIAYGDELSDAQAAYERGDYESALRVFDDLAEKGNPVAQRSLGLMYFEGKGVSQDLVKAYAWISVEASQGLKGAKEKRDNLATKLVDFQLEEEAWMEINYLTDQLAERRELEARLRELSEWDISEIRSAYEEAWSEKEEKHKDYNKILHERNVCRAEIEDIYSNALYLKGLAKDDANRYKDHRCVELTGELEELDDIDVKHH